MFVNGADNEQVDLSTRPDKSVGSDDIWAKAEAALEEALKAKQWDYAVDEGGGAFYGPKIDIKIEDAIGRRWQCSTIQLDFNLPERFEMVRYLTVTCDCQAICVHQDDKVDLKPAASLGMSGSHAGGILHELDISDP